MINFEALFKVSYGLYIVCSGDKDKGNGFISNTFFQVTAEPAKFASCCNKNNYTAELIQKHETFSVSVLGEEAPSELFGTFGYKSGREVDKFQGMNVKYGETGVPIVLNSSIASLEFKVVQTVDVGTHLMFIGELVCAELVEELKDPMTYLYYRQIKKGLSPKNAPTYIDKSKLELKATDSTLKSHKCVVCGYIHDEASETIKFKDLPNDWVCPICGAEQSDFIEI